MDRAPFANCRGNASPFLLVSSTRGSRNSARLSSSSLVPRATSQRPWAGACLKYSSRWIVGRSAGRLRWRAISCHESSPEFCSSVVEGYAPAYRKAAARDWPLLAVMHRYPWPATLRRSQLGVGCAGGTCVTQARRGSWRGRSAIFGA